MSDKGNKKGNKGPKTPSKGSKGKDAKSNNQDGQSARLSARQRKLKIQKEIEEGSFNEDPDSLPLEEMAGDTKMDVLHPRRYKQSYSILHKHAVCRAVCYIRNQNRTV